MKYRMNLKNLKQAPETEEKLYIIATENLAIERLIETKELIERGGKYFNKDVISSSDLFDALLLQYPKLIIDNNKKNVILKKLGYFSMPRVIKIDNKTRRIWLKIKMNNDEIRKLLKNH